MFVHPHCVLERRDDLDEVRRMIELGECDVAVDELLWLLSECAEMLEGHVLLARIALSENQDVPLARAHFGIAYDLGLKALRRAGMPRPLPCRLPANQPFFDAGLGLAQCLKQLDRLDMAADVLRMLLDLDPSDPLKLRTQLDSLCDTPRDRGPLVSIDPQFIPPGNRQG